MVFTKKKLNKDISFDYGSGHIEIHKKGEELDVIEEIKKPKHYCVAIDVGVWTYIEKDYFND